MSQILPDYRPHMGHRNVGIPFDPQWFDGRAHLLVAGTDFPVECSPQSVRSSLYRRKRIHNERHADDQIKIMVDLTHSPGNVVVQVMRNA